MRWYFLLCLYLLNGISDSVADDAKSVNPAKQLFHSTDPINILNFTNFDAQIRLKLYSQIVLFYDKNQEQSQIYALVYEKLAESFLPAQEALQFDAIDCSEGRNVRICFNHTVKEYPSARYLREYVLYEDVDYVGDVIDLPWQNKAVFDVLRKFRPDLFPIENITSVYPEFIPINFLEDVIIIFEESSSLLGPQVMVDFYKSANLLLRRGYTNSPLARKLGIYEFPTTVGYSKKSNYSVPTILTFENSNVEEVEQAIREYVYRDRNVAVSYTDLEMAIRRSLEVEATSHFLVKEDTDALLDYLGTLILLFPAAKQSNLRPFLIDLRKALSTKQCGNWDSKEVYDLVKELESKHYPVFLAPVPARYETCSGHNGYRCALWLLFQTLLGQADQAMPLMYYGPFVLRAMYGYTQHFQQDRINAEHFNNAMKVYNMNDVRTNQEARLWLWWVHNQIRKLENDKSMTTPPDVIYPTLEQCPLSRQLETNDPENVRIRNPCKVCDVYQDAGPDYRWVITEVDDFLKKRFGNGRIALSKFGE